MSLPFVKLDLQRGKGDCGIAALAMLTGQVYEDVFATAVGVLPAPHKTGLSAQQLIEIASGIGVNLSLRKSWDLETDCGLLTVERLKPSRKYFAQHLVLLKFGLIFDTDGTVWEPDVYFAQQKFRPVSFFSEEE